MKQVYSKKIDVPIYEERLEVVFTKQFEKTITKYTRRKYSDCEAIVIPKRDKIIVVFSIPCSINTLVHEVTHIKNAIYHSHSMTLDCNNDESEAYLMGWLSESIHNVYIEAKRELCIK